MEKNTGSNDEVLNRQGNFVIFGRKKYYIVVVGIFNITLFGSRCDNNSLYANDLPAFK